MRLTDLNSQRLNAEVTSSRDEGKRVTRDGIESGKTLYKENYIPRRKIHSTTEGRSGSLRGGAPRGESASRESISRDPGLLDDRVVRLVYTGVMSFAKFKVFSLLSWNEIELRNFSVGSILSLSPSSL